MPYPARFLRLVASGTLFDVEEFSFSMSLGAEAGGSNAAPTVPTSVPESIVDAFEVFFQSGLIGTAARLTTLKLNAIGPDGRYLSDSTTVFHDYGSPGIAGLGNATQHPPQIALAVTLRTARARGRAHAGRFYLPSLNLAVGPDGRVGGSEIETATTKVVTLLDAINSAIEGTRIIVASDIGEGTFEPVTGVTIGRTFDTIRSRRTSIPEGYAAPVPLAP